MERMRTTVLCCCVIALAGCAGLKEGAKGIAGVSTKILEDTREKALKKTFTCDYDTCYSKTKDILKKIGAYIYAQSKEKQLIAIYVSEQDTTPVGLFFQETEKGKTQVEVSSPSTYAKELIANKVFSALTKALAPPKQ